MKLSFSTNAFVRFSVLEAIEAIAGIGYAGIELLADTPHLYPFSITSGELSQVAALVRKKGLQVANINANTAVGYYGQRFWEPLFEPSLANPDRNARKWRVEYTKKCIDMARVLDCPNVSVTSGRMVPGISLGKSVALLRESLAEVLDYAISHEIRIAMEYEPGLLVECSEELLQLIGDLGVDHFGANLDLGHSHVLGEDPNEVAASLSFRILHVHIEDIRRKKHYHLIPGEGDMDFDKLIRVLEGVDYQGFLTVELYTYPDSPVDAARRAFEYLNNLHSFRVEK